jgi:hypothetical protein
VGDIEQFIRDAARKRGIDPDIAVRVAKSEGSVTEPARLGDFSGHPWYSGKSWWPFQLHYGGKGYEHFGNTAGMGNHFTELTGWQPGDPKAWQDSVRYALNRAKAGGWKPWYGAAHVGIGQWDGIDRTHPWDAHGERWDYEAGTAPGGGAMPVKFDPHYPAVIQNDDWSCAPTSLTWAMKALGRHPGDNFIEDDMVRLGLVTHEQGLMNHTGSGIVTWLQIGDAQHYGSDGYGISNNQNPISWDVLVPEITPYPPYPLLLGLPNWGGLGKGHWSGVRGFDPGRGVILLANPDTGTTYGHAALTRQQFESRAGGNASIVRVLHPDLLGATPEPPPKPRPPVTQAEFDAALAPLLALRDRLPAA